MNVDDLADAIKSSLLEYGNEVGEAFNEVSHDLSKEGVNLLKANSPKDTGNYRKGWRLKKSVGRKGRIRSLEQFTIYNKTHYRLTHLLEKGHAKADGTGRVNAKVHIKPVEDNIADELVDRLAQAVSSR